MTTNYQRDWPKRPIDEDNDFLVRWGFQPYQACEGVDKYATGENQDRCPICGQTVIVEIVFDFNIVTMHEYRPVGAWS